MSPGCVHGKRVGRRLSWILLLLLAALAACGEAAPTPFPTAAGVTRVAATPTSQVAQRYTNEAAGFSFDLPDGWIVAEQGVTRLGRYY
jgi:predicted small lipoprotein YifL